MQMGIKMSELNVNRKSLTCIVCPVGCSLEVEINKDGAILVEGNGCKRGEEYAKSELTNPTRMITTTVAIYNGKLKRLPVFTEKEIPKDMIFEAMEAINKVRVTAPVKRRDVIVENLLGTGIKVLASRGMDTEM